MKQTKFCFSMEELGLKRGEPTAAKDVEIMTRQGFLLIANPAFTPGVIKILSKLPKEIREVFPVNVVRELRKIGIEEDYEVAHEIEVNIESIQGNNGKEFVRIESLDISVTIIRKGVGEAVFNFYVFISPEGKISEIKGNPRNNEAILWQIVGPIKREIDKWFFFHELIDKWKNEAKVVERQERIIPKARAIEEGFNLLFA